MGYDITKHADVRIFWRTPTTNSTSVLIIVVTAIKFNYFSTSKKTN